MASASAAERPFGTRAVGWRVQVAAEPEDARGPSREGTVVAFRRSDETLRVAFEDGSETRLPQSSPRLLFLSRLRNRTEKLAELQLRRKLTRLSQSNALMSDIVGRLHERGLDPAATFAKAITQESPRRGDSHGAAAVAPAPDLSRQSSGASASGAESGVESGVEGSGSSSSDEEEGSEEESSSEEEEEESSGEEEESEDEEEESEEESDDEEDEDDDEEDDDEDEDEDDEDDDDDQPVRVKWMFRGQIRAALLPTHSSLKRVVARLQREYGEPSLALSYRDDEGDEVAIHTQGDWRLALQQHAREGAPSLRVLLQSEGEGEEAGAAADEPPPTPQPATPKTPQGETDFDDFNWQRGELLGRGSFGKVYSALDLRTGQLMAVKQVKYDKKSQDSRAVKSLQREITLLRKLDHPNIIKYLGTQRKANKLFIFLEHASGGSVAQALSKFGPFSEAVTRRYVHQLLLGLDYLHREGVIHRDIKGSNLLIDKGTIRLADFGCSKQTTAGASEAQHTSVGTTQFMAPEVLRGEEGDGYGRKADIWSLGMAAVEMLTGRPAWPTPAATIFNLCMTTDVPPLPEEVSPEARDFLARCFERDSALRPDASQLLHHPFLEQRQDRDMLRTASGARPAVADASGAASGAGGGGGEIRSSRLRTLEPAPAPSWFTEGGGDEHDAARALVEEAAAEAARQRPKTAVAAPSGYYSDDFEEPISFDDIPVDVGATADGFSPSRQWTVVPASPKGTSDSETSLQLYKTT